MKRQKIDGGGWFNPETAREYKEDTRWDGRNHISKNTGSQWDHEALYRTTKGAWVLHSWSQWAGSGESWERIDDDRAVEWLITNEEEPPKELSKIAESAEV